MNPGSIVRCRNRDWVLLPEERSITFLLRPLTGAIDEVVAVHKSLTNLIGGELPAERVQSATFPLPTADDLVDAGGAHLLWQAARLTLREGATPFRSLGRISIRPRIYQLVPLLMALRLETIRMMIADDVGVGKTIEALLVVRELFDRGEIKRLCVLCPPYLCEQWQKELSEKFNLDAVIIRSGTIGQLERKKTSQDTVYNYYPVQVASIDFVKSERNKHLFLQHCPDLVIVDEAHGAAAAEHNQDQHQRHLLIQEIAARDNQHIILLTATPHSGIERAFRSLLALLNPEFGIWDSAALSEPQRAELVRHFIQRTRRDIETDWEGEHCFPHRESVDETYRLSTAYRNLFAKTYAFCSEIVHSGKKMDRRQQRVRYWGALALLRCVMSSPAAAIAALEARHDALTVDGDETGFRSFIYESDQDRTDDEQPNPPIESTEATLPDTDRRKLRELGRMAQTIVNNREDAKLTCCAELLAKIIREGFHPIIWCRYIATADYVAQGLQQILQAMYPDIRVISITGRKSDDERRIMVEELAAEPRRVLVATDCLSEGINLQHAFDAALHYDLPWNPNRLEQREGRVDRYGGAKIVKAIRYFSPDSAVDGIVLDVLLNKAREIHRTLGTHVPVPEESESVTEAVLNALFLRKRPSREAGTEQLELELEMPEVTSFHQCWDRDAERERINRTRFAQRALKPAEVRQELDATDAVLGDPNEVREFVLSAAQRLNLHIIRDKRTDVFRVAIGDAVLATLPPAIKYVLPAGKGGQWLITFTSPTPENVEYLGRNHRFVAALARFLMEQALTRPGQAIASRCGVIRTRAVSRISTVLLLRVRYLINQPRHAPLLSEEVLAVGFNERKRTTDREWLPDGEALRLLVEAQADGNIPMGEKRELATASLDLWSALQPELCTRIEQRVAELEKSYKRVRQAASLRVRELDVVPQFPPDLLGILVLQPAVAS